MARKKRDFIAKYLIPRIRQMFRWWPEKHAAVLAATTRPGFRECAHCKDEWPKEQTDVDHIDPVGAEPPEQPWDTYIYRVLCSRHNLQVLCKECHKRKTVRDLKRIRDEKKLQRDRKKVSSK